MAGAVIDVQIRNQNGTPGPRFIHIRLESAEGGAVADADTIEGGKCQFNLPKGGVFIVRLSGQGYQEVSERVEVIGIPRGFVTLTLKPLPGVGLKEPEKVELPGTISTGELNIPEKARKECEAGEEALQAKDPAKAAKHFQQAVKLYDSYPRAYRMLGEAYLEQKQWTESEEAFKKSIALDPTLVDPYIDLGAVYNQQKNYGQAETALKKGLELSPQATSAKYELAKTYWATNRWQEAAPYVRDVVNKTPNLAGAHVLFANILLRQRDAKGALREYKQYLELDPGGSMAAQVREQVEKLQKALGQ
jgi:Tfp pilus assembly protein PilF